MIELLLGTQRLEGFYPNSGPGPKRLLVGDPTYGVFGVTSDEDLGGASELMVSRLKAQNPTRAHHNYGNDSWLKMFINGNVFYYPYNPLAYGFSVRDIIMGRMYGDSGRSIAVVPHGQTTVTGGAEYSGPQDFRFSTVNEGCEWKLAGHLMSVDPINRPINAWSNVANGYETAHIFGLAYGTSTNPIASSPLFTKMARFTDEFGNYAVRVAGVTVYNGNKGSEDPGFDIVSGAYSTHASANEQGIHGVIQYLTHGEAGYFRPILKLESGAATVFEFFPIHSPNLQAETPYSDQGISSISTSDAISALILEDALAGDNAGVSQGIRSEVTSTATAVTVHTPSISTNTAYSIIPASATAGVGVVEQSEIEKQGVWFTAAIASSELVLEANLRDTLADKIVDGEFVDSFTEASTWLMTYPSNLAFTPEFINSPSPSDKPASFYSSAGPILINPTFTKA